MRPAKFLQIAIVTLAAAAISCGPPEATRPDIATADECILLNELDRSADQVTIATLDAVDPLHAPQPVNASEQLVFAQLYETLITLDCSNEVRPSLAESWTRHDGGRMWSFRINENARFSDGLPVSARHVAESWQRMERGIAVLNAGIDSTRVEGDRVLLVYFENRHRKVPRVLSARAFAVTRLASNRLWPVGTGPYAINESNPGAADRFGRSVTARPSFGAGGPTLRFIEASTRNARDLLENEVDVVVTSDPDIIEYAAGRSHLLSTPLRWDRTYVLLSTTRAIAVPDNKRRGDMPVLVDSKFALDAVRSDARACLSPYWWNALTMCEDLRAAVPGFPPSPSGASPDNTNRRILYNEEDAVARGLAERIVALAAASESTAAGVSDLFSSVPGLSSGSPRCTAHGSAAGPLAASLYAGNDFAYIVPVAVNPLDPCYETRRLMNRARWLAPLDRDIGEAVIPLVDTRVHLIANRSRVALTVDGNGNVLIANGMLGKE